MEALIDSRFAHPFFISEEIGESWWPGERALTQVSCRYHPAAYSDALFGELSITCPVWLSRAALKRRAEFLAGRHCARQVLAAMRTPGVGIGIGANREPLWPVGIAGSISHSGDIAVAVASKSRNILGIGVDVEEWLSPDTVREVSGTILSGAEQWLLEHPELTPEQALTLVFSAKESFFKAAFPLVNRYFDFDAVSMVDLDLARAEFLFRVNYSLHPLVRPGKLFSGRFHMPVDRGPSGPSWLATLVVIQGRS